MAAICFTLLCTSFPIALWKENKDSSYVGKWLLCGNCHHMAAISKFKMAATLLDMQFSKREIDVAYIVSCHWESCCISISFRWLSSCKIIPIIMGKQTVRLWQPYSISRWRLHCRSFSVSLSIPRYMSTYHSSSRLLITGPTTFAKRGAFHVCLETIAIPHAILSTFAWYQCKESYLSDSQCGQFRNITGSLGCLPSPISIVWKFSDCPHKCPDW